ncbi:hypothetical protein DPEC_G00117880 [Dallia pectoralis]|uniref:Uncharacterized protein n=1 Tax=Dallia pectoralis TaxID=75939 RepID=A0ACC2GUS8_DALPE|nr:hypothetical protein DPEC_G00117880 [Dallia pectoralis]
MSLVHLIWRKILCVAADICFQCPFFLPRADCREPSGIWKPSVGIYQNVELTSPGRRPSVHKAD